MRPLPPIKRLTVITGHYGCGKTNLAVNLALDLAEEHEDVTVIDLDVVNPYFRSSDYTALLEARGVHVVAPVFAGTTLDVPVVSGMIAPVIGGGGHVIIDAGGDDVGATALGQYAGQISAVDHDLLYVINRNRNLTGTPAEAAGLLPEIEAASHLKATGVVNNTHLRRDTTAETVLGSLGYARDTAALLGLPLRFTTVPESLIGAFSDEPGSPTFVENQYPVKIHVRTPWEHAAGATEEAR